MKGFTCLLLLLVIGYDLPALAADAIPSQEAAAHFVVSTADLALIQASLDGDANAATQALAQGARLEIRHGLNGLTPLMLAIYRDHLELVPLLLKQGANVNTSNLEGQSPLIMAAAGGQTEIIASLLASGAQCNAVDHAGNSALMWAAFWGHLDVVRQLLSAGASATQRNKEGNTALLLAAQGGVSQQTRILLTKSGHAPNGRRLPVYFDDSEEAQLLLALLKAGADPNAQNQQAQSTLMLLAAAGRSRSVAVLLQAGATPNSKDQSGLTAANYAQRAGFGTLAVQLQPQNSIVPLPE